MENTQYHFQSPELVDKMKCGRIAYVVSWCPHNNKKKGLCSPLLPIVVAKFCATNTQSYCQAGQKEWGTCNAFS